MYNESFTHPLGYWSAFKFQPALFKPSDNRKISKTVEPIAITEVAGVPKMKMLSILRNFASIYLAVSIIALVLSTYPSKPWKSIQAHVHATVAPARLPLTVGLLRWIFNVNICFYTIVNISLPVDSTWPVRCNCILMMAIFFVWIQNQRAS